MNNPWKLSIEIVLEGRRDVEHLNRRRRCRFNREDIIRTSEYQLV
jgi:hypothetical protein